jgi:hypothetical protein
MKEENQYILVKTTIKIVVYLIYYIFSTIILV